MARVIDFPPKLDCPFCHIRLRPATRAELNEDLRSGNLQRRQIAQSAAQGAHDWEPPRDWDEWEKAMTPPGSWLFRCDCNRGDCLHRLVRGPYRCDHRTLWSRVVEAGGEGR
jgi:hypothetical protein